MSDLCATCHQNSTLILRAANTPEEVKSDTLKKAEEHLYLAQLERSFYKTTCKECEKSILEHFTNGDSFQPPPLALPIQETSRRIILSIMPSKCSIPLIPSSLVQFTS